MKVDFVFAGDQPDLTFVEVENHATGESMSIGQWDETGRRLTVDVIGADYFDILSNSSTNMGQALAAMFNIMESLLFGDLDRTEEILNRAVAEYVRTRRDFK